MPTLTNVDDYALVVGIDEYPKYRPLKGAVRDAKDFAKWLCDEPHGGGLPPGNCKTVYSAKTPLSPLQDQIDEGLEEIFSSIPKGKLARRLYLYFSGHGMAETNLITDLCLANWAEKFPNRALNAEDYLEALMKLGKFEQVVILLDCCRVRLVAVQGHAPDFIVPTPGRDTPKVRYFLANATEFLNSSYEAATQNKADDGEPIVRGYFTRALMAALRGEAAIPSGGVPASCLKNYLEDKVPILASKDGYTQDPEVTNGLKGDPVFGSAAPIPPVGDLPPGSSGDKPIIPPTRGPAGPTDRFSLTLSNSVGARSLAVLDRGNKAVFRGPVRTPKKLRLPAGLYNLLTTFDKTTVTTSLQLDKETHISTQEQLHAAPEYYTAVPLENAPTSHEYYTIPSEQWSKQATRDPLPGTPDSSLFIFIRAVDREKHGPKGDFGKGLVLVNSQGKEVSDLSAPAIQQDPEAGWLAFHVAAPHETLYLRFTGERAREFPLHLYPGWQTQAFLIYRGKPLFETLKIFLARVGKGFQPKAEETRAADIALNGLQSSRDLLSENALQLLLHGKFDNPILGLVGAHVLVQRHRALQNRLSFERRDPGPGESKQRQEDEKRISVVLNRLDSLLPGSSDVAALRLAASFLRSSAKRKLEFHHPPMFRLGLQAVLAVAARRPAIIAEDSLISKIAPRLYADTPWSTWRPEVEQGPINWVHLAILDFIEKTGEPIGKAKKTPPTSAGLIAEQLGLPQQTVIEAARDLRTRPGGSLRRSLPPEYKPLLKQAKARLAQLASSTSKRLRPQSLKNARTKSVTSTSVRKQTRPAIIPDRVRPTRLSLATVRKKAALAGKRPFMPSKGV